MKQPKLHPFGLKIPHRPVSQQLANGCIAYLMPIPDTQLLRIDFMFGGGQWVQNQTLQARFAYKSLRDGTRSYSAEQIEQQLDYYGATLEASANLAYGYLTLRCLRKYLPQLLPIIRSLLSEPLYDAQHLNIALAQARMMWQINHQKVETLGKELLYEHLFGDQHPMGWNIHIGDYDSINSDVLLNYHRHYFHAANCSLLITGGFRSEDVDSVSSCLPVNRNASPVIYEEKPVLAEVGSEFVENTPFETVQCAVRVGCLLPVSKHPDMPLIRLAATILGGYFGSRLMTNIREEKGYTYDIHNTIYNVPFGNAMVIKTETTNELTPAVLSEIRRELQRLEQEPVQKNELQNVLNYMTGNQSRHYELNFDFPQTYMTLLSLGRTLDDIIEENRIQQDVTPLQLQDIAARFFSPERFVYALAGN